MLKRPCERIDVADRSAPDRTPTTGLFNASPNCLISTRQASITWSKQQLPGKDRSRVSMTEGVTERKPRSNQELRVIEYAVSETRIRDFLPTVWMYWPWMFILLRE